MSDAYQALVETNERGRVTVLEEACKRCPQSFTLMFQLDFVYEAWPLSPADLAYFAERGVDPPTSAAQSVVSFPFCPACLYWHVIGAAPLPFEDGTEEGITPAEVERQMGEARERALDEVECVAHPETGEMVWIRAEK